MKSLAKTSKWKKRTKEPTTDNGEIIDAADVHEPDKEKIECAPCDREKRKVAATNFCENCEENLCQSCVQQHLKFPTMKYHVIYTHGGLRVAVKPLHVETCTKHDGKILDMYCFDHDEVHCAACIAMNHRACKQVTYLPEAAKNIAESEEYKEVLANIDEVRSELSTSRLRRSEDNTRIAKEREDAILRIKYVRKRTDMCLDKLENLTMGALDGEYKGYNKRINEDIGTCDTIIVNLEEMSNQLSMEVVQDDSHRFISMRKAKQTVKKGRKTVTTLEKLTGTEQIQFLPDSRINDLVKSLPALGSFASEQRLLSATPIGQYDVHLAGDVTDCQILGSDFLPDGKVLLSDWENKKIKLLNTSFKVIDHLKLPVCPYSVCTVNQNEGIASLTNKKMLQIFSIDARNKMTASRVIKTRDICRGVAYHNGRVYVVCGTIKEGSQNQVVIYSLDGTFIQNIGSDSSGEALFQRPLYIALNSIGTMFVSDEDTGVVALDDTGKGISMFSDKCLKYPYGVTVINNDQLFVCGFGTHNVIQVGRNSVLLGEVISESAGLRNPRSVCYDVNSQRILVTCKNTNLVRVYSLK